MQPHPIINLAARRAARQLTEFNLGSGVLRRRPGLGLGQLSDSVSQPQPRLRDRRLRQTHCGGGRPASSTTVPVLTVTLGVLGSLSHRIEYLRNHTMIESSDLRKAQDKKIRTTEFLLFPTKELRELCEMARR